MKLNKFVVVLVALMFTSWNQAQEVGLPIYKDYLTDNWYLLYPSMAGASSNNKLRATARQAWFDVDDAPNLQTISANFRAGNNVGLGGIFMNDQNGRFSQTGVYLTFAYHLDLTNSSNELNQLSFGASVGILQEGLDATDIIDQQPDPSFPFTAETESFFNVDIGMSYNYQDFFIHAAARNIIPTERKILTELARNDNQRQYLFSVGYNFYRRGSRWSFQPSTLFQLKEFTGESNIDINGKAFYELDNGSLWGGLSYRRSLDGAEFSADLATEDSQKLNTISPFIGITLNKFMFAYTYTYQPDEIVLTNSGFHQITLGYNFGSGGKKYKCNCPAVNY